MSKIGKICVLLVVGFLLCYGLFHLLAYLCTYDIPSPDLYVGQVVDIQVSAGGYGHSDLAVVTIQDGRKFTVIGFRSYWRTGNWLCDRHGSGKWYYVSDVCGGW